MTYNTGAFGARPAAGNEGDLYFPNDGYTIDYDDGANWIPWGPIFPMTPPPTTGWSWVNQSGSSVNETKDAIHLNGGTGANVNLALRVRTMPTPPFVLSTYITFNLLITALTGCFLVLRDSNSSRITGYGYRFSNILGTWLAIDQYIDTGNWNNTPKSDGCSLDANIGLQIEDDNTNLYYRWSVDMQHWLLFYTQARTTWLANADQIGFGVRTDNSGKQYDMTILSWEIT